MTGTDRGANDWSTYWSGRASLADQSEFRAPAIEQDKDLGAFWQNELSTLPAEARFLDLACGAGTVIRHAHERGIKNRIGLDISPEAISLMMSRYPGTRGLVGSALDIPVASGSIDMLTSQFGFEYAGVMDCLPAIVRALSPGGRFIALVHMSEGSIAVSSKRDVDEAKALADTGFFPAARRVFEAINAAEKAQKNPKESAEADEAIRALEGPRDAITRLAASGHQLALQTLTGTQMMFQRRKAYSLDDITGWLDRVEGENAAHMNRMQGMLDAALTKAEADLTLEALRARGLITGPAVAFRATPDTDPFAWILKASKPQI